ncbi:MAG: LacI family DNA-binding transcriptional regulator [Candidatus Pristimantibacillus sp.]
MAKLAGVSEATVSRVMNKVGPIKEETRVRVLAAAEQLGYEPNALAQQFARKKSGNIGVIVPFMPKVHLFSTYYFAEILSGIGEVAKRYDYNLLLIFQEQDDPRDYAKLFRTQKIDACIILGSQNIPEERQALAALKQGGYPFCLVNQQFIEEDYMVVDADHREGSLAVMQHLLLQGRRRIAFLNGPDVFSSSIDRLEGYQRALNDAGIVYDKRLIYEGNYSRKSGYQASAAISELVKNGDIDAIFAANDRMAIGLMDGLREQGIEAGRDVGLVGYDDSDGSRIVSPKLSTVAVPFYEMGRIAALRLLAPDQENNSNITAMQSKDENVEQQTWLLPVHFAQRESSEIPN